MTDYPLVAHAITSLSDLYLPNSTKLKTRNQLEDTQNVIMDMETYEEIVSSVRAGIMSLGIIEDQLSTVRLPLQPLLTKIATWTKKGCNFYYRLLRKKENLKTNLGKHEAKWHQELNCILSTEFWNSSYNLSSQIKYDNRIKWLQYQINRNSLYTNYRVNKFNQMVSPKCTFCLLSGAQSPSLEKISHLFCLCKVVRKFWAEVADFMISFGVIIPLQINTLLFGNHVEDVSSVSNVVILNAKQYIWRSKQAGALLNFTAFKKHLHAKLTDLKNAYLHINKIQLFDQWLHVYNNLPT